MAVLYAVAVEVLVWYRHIGWKDLYRISLSTGIVTAVVFILVAAGAAFSWLIGYARIPEMILCPPCWGKTRPWSGSF